MKHKNTHNLSDNTMNFLLYSYLKMDLEDLEKKSHKEIILICAKRAYRDLNRTLRFSTKSVQERQNFLDKNCALIRNDIIKLLKKVNSCKEVDKIYFDELHDEICKKIIKACRSFKTETDNTTLLIMKNTDTVHHTKRKEHNFYYGQAQKWLNMTLKYMWLLGLWEKEFDKILPVLHAPVDNFIIEKIRKNPDIFLPHEDEKLISWSKWDGLEYLQFQNSLRNVLGSAKPIEWECSAWLEIAKNRKNNYNLSSL